MDGRGEGREALWFLLVLVVVLISAGEAMACQTFTGCGPVMIEEQP